MQTETKRCRRCGTVKPIFDYYMDRTRGDRRQRDCKSCQIIRAKEAYRRRDQVTLRWNYKAA